MAYMESWGLVAHDDQTFMAKVVNFGTEEGILTRDRVDEIIRISVAMANKYVLQKEVDFRSPEELAKVQETILKLVGVGLEIKSGALLEEGVRLLMEGSPVELFRLAYTRIERLRQRWKLLLVSHRVEILVSSEEYGCLSELTCQRLSEMSIFTEPEIYTIRSLTMEDKLFTSLGVLEYYESELERYEFILRMKEILPFDLLNRSANVNVENLSEVDSIREALISTLVISAFLQSSDPVTVSMADVRAFLSALDLVDVTQVFSQELEDVVIELIQELGEGLEEREASMLTREMVEAARKLIETVVGEWDTVDSPAEITFFKRWSRLAILSDAPDPIDRILTDNGTLDDFDFEMLVEKVSNLQANDALELAERLPWTRMTPTQVVTMFHRFQDYQKEFARFTSLTGFTAEDIADLLEDLDLEAIQELKPALQSALTTSHFTLEELELLIAPRLAELSDLLWTANPPADMGAGRVIREYNQGSKIRRQILFGSCLGAAFFPELFREAWEVDPSLVKRQMKTIPESQVGRLLVAASGGKKPKVIASKSEADRVEFDAKALNGLFKSLPASKRKAALTFLSES